MRVPNKEFPLTLEEAKSFGFGIDYNSKVKEFMTTFGQPVLDKPTDIPEDRNKLRINLLFEELKEYAEASGLSDYFADLSANAIEEFTKDPHIAYVPVVDPVEQLDALCDLQYVLSGAVHEHGFGNIFDEAFNEVHSSNMSKADDNVDDAIITLDSYRDQGIETYFFNKNEKYVQYRKPDNKVLKSHKYRPAKLTQFLK